MDIDIKEFKDIPFAKRTHCVICGKGMQDPTIELPNFPLTEIYTSKKPQEKVGLLDQEFHLCKNCGHGQISHVIDPEFLYGKWYVTRTSTSPSASAAIDIFLEFINDILRDKPIKDIVEIGCNDLYMLKKLRGRANRLYGIDPILAGKEEQLKDDKIEVIGDFFENVDLKEISSEIDVILSSHTLEHVGDPKRLIQRLINNTASGTLFFFQFPGLETLIRDNRFDHIFHQHLNYFSLKSTIYMLNEIGAELIDYRINPYHWGALMIAFKKRRKGGVDPYAKFAKSIRQLKDAEIIKQYSVFKDCMDITRRRLKSVRDKKIYGYGAALMLPVLDYHLGGMEMLKCIIDDDKAKDGLYYINLPIQIRPLDKIGDFRDSVFLVTAINSLETARAIIARLIELKVEQIIVPINAI